MIDYTFRNQETGKEFKIASKRKIAEKRFSETDYRIKNNIPEGYEFMYAANYKTSARERKAK